MLNDKKIMFYRISTLFLLISSIAIISCNKEGIGGKASISGTVQHNGKAIPDAVVYIKYGADEFPSFDFDQYDDNVIVNGTDASFSFENLYKGNYYLHAVGYDVSIMENVGGGLAVKINNKKELIVTEIPVTN